MTRPARSHAGGIGALLVVGLALRLIIAYLLPGSGFSVDIGSFSYWAQNLASQGPSGFYERPFFHDYTPGYLYVLWAMGIVGGLIGQGISILGQTFTLTDLLKLPPILADLALAWLTWTMTLELGGSRRSAWIGALLVVLTPVTWLDSVLWGQVDSVGVVVLLFALRELWRDRPERAAVLAMLAALIKPQLGILIPIVAVVTIRRALWPTGGFGADDPEDVQRGGTRWERTVTGPIRIATTALAGLATAIVVSLPFGLSLPDLIGQIFKTAAGYPYVSVNAYNPWALASLNGIGVAANRGWVCDSTILPSGPIDISIFGISIYQAPASTLSCPDAFYLGPVPALFIGMGLFLLVAAVVVWRVALRPDRRTMLVGLAVLAIAFFVLPTRVHERYLFPLVGIGAILAAVSLRWRVAYLVASAAVLANMYAVLTTLYPGNPGIADWLDVGDVLTSWWGIAVAAAAVSAVLLFALFQLRGAGLERLQEEIERRPEGGFAMGWPFPEEAVPQASPTLPATRSIDDVPASLPAGAAGLVAVPGTAVVTPASGGLMPTWDDREPGTGPLAWVRARFNDRPFRADRTAALEHEGGGRFDKLDLWIVVVLVAALSIVRVWRLSEPYDMHFDEVYHPRTAMEFLQLWRYGMSHDIYEWTHPHIAKYAMAIGLEAFGGDQVTATTDIGMADVKDAVVEPRWDDPGHDRSGDRLWVAGSDEVQAYDLSTRALIGSWAVPGIVDVGIDTNAHRAFVATSSGQIETIDTMPLDSLRASGSSLGNPPVVQPEDWGVVTGPVDGLHVTSDGQAVMVVTGDPAAPRLVTMDGGTAEQLGTVTSGPVAQIADHGDGQIVVAAGQQLLVVDNRTGKLLTTAQLDGTAGGITETSGLASDPMYVAYRTSAGVPWLAIVSFSTTPTVSATTGSPFQLPGDATGRLYYDASSRMIHAIGTSPADVDRGSGSRETVYVIDPNGSPPSDAVYEDAPLPFDAVTAAMDDAQQFPSADRQQLLVFSSSGEMGSIPAGDHAWAWRLPGVVAGVLMGALMYVLGRLLFKRREIAVILGFLTLADGMLFVQSRIGMNDSYVGLGIVAAYTLFAWLWLRPGGGRRQWVAWAVAMPILGVTLGIALASKWVAAYAIGGLGILILGRSALGRLILNIGMVVATAVLGYLAISVAGAAFGGDFIFLGVMVVLTAVSVMITILHPIAWTPEEERLAVYGPIGIGAVILVAGLLTGHLESSLPLLPASATPLALGFLAWLVGAGMYTAFHVAGRYGFGPRAGLPDADDPRALLDAPAPPAAGWLNLGSGFGLPAFFTLACLVVLPVVVYVITYIPWAFVGQDQLFPGWPPGHTGQTLTALTVQMYDYHEFLASPHPASSPWWAWPLDLKPVWFYQDSFAGATSASIYNAGNLISWWLAIPAVGFVMWQAYKRRSLALGLILVGFLVQWISWARIDRASFQYHYYTAIPFLLAMLAYFLAELWHGPSWRTWMLARIAGAAVVLGPFGLWLLNRPLCGIAQVDVMNPGSSACPTLIPDLTLSPQLVGVAVVVGLAAILLLRLFLSPLPPDEAGPGSALRERMLRAGAIALVMAVAYAAITVFVPTTSAIHLSAVPVEPIALIVEIALLPVAAFVATARDSRRFVLGLLAAIGLWFVVWYPNISALPLPNGLTNVYQGLLPSYLYPFQFWSNTATRGGGPPIFSAFDLAMLVVVAGLAAAIAYSTWSWRIALAERRAAGPELSDGEARSI
ncbi:MAG TPA: phospholipid carrier-dependent glycosyltransferase [Candidatus Limnocylindrales bacterium]|nr:phospholipid carrier-dependent glycosyltransferase [Candidatus Limnocylindrales bacterium]